jgi:hypothetical protein
MNVSRSEWERILKRLKDAEARAERVNELTAIAKDAYSLVEWLKARPILMRHYSSGVLEPLSTMLKQANDKWNFYPMPSEDTDNA